MQRHRNLSKARSTSNIPKPQQPTATTSNNNNSTTNNPIYLRQLYLQNNTVCTETRSIVYLPTLQKSSNSSSLAHVISKASNFEDQHYKKYLQLTMKLDAKFQQQIVKELGGAILSDQAEENQTYETLSTDFKKVEQKLSDLVRKYDFENEIYNRMNNYMQLYG